MSARLIGIEIGVKEQQVTYSLQEPSNVNFVKAEIEGHDWSTCSTLFGNQRSSQNLVDVASINTDGEGQNEHSRHQTRGERTHNREEVCPEASRTHAWKGPPDKKPPDNGPPDKKKTVPQRRTGDTSSKDDDFWRALRAKAQSKEKLRITQISRW